MQVDHKLRYLADMGKGHCDGCDKDRSDVRSCGQDANGDADAPDLCFICRKEASRGRFYDRGLKRYVRHSDVWLVHN